MSISWYLGWWWLKFRLFLVNIIIPGPLMKGFNFPEGLTIPKGNDKAVISDCVFVEIKEAR